MRIVAFELHLARLEIIARVILVRDADRTDIERFHILKKVVLAQRQHM